MPPEESPDCSYVSSSWYRTGVNQTRRYGTIIARHNRHARTTVATAIIATVDGVRRRSVAGSTARVAAGLTSWLASWLAARVARTGLRNHHRCRGRHDDRRGRNAGRCRPAVRTAIEQAGKPPAAAAACRTSDKQGKGQQQAELLHDTHPLATGINRGGLLPAAAERRGVGRDVGQVGKTVGARAAVRDSSIGQPGGAMQLYNVICDVQTQRRFFSTSLRHGCCLRATFLWLTNPLAPFPLLVRRPAVSSPAPRIVPL